MGYAAVKDVHSVNSPGNCGGAALYLRYHAAGDDAAFYQAGYLLRVDDLNKRAFVVLIHENALGVGKKYELFRT